MLLVQIVTGLPPFTDGIGDYAVQLARQLRERHDIQTSFLVADPSWNGGAVEGFAATKIRTRTKQGLFDGIEEARLSSASERFAILLHSSPYGYSRRGCPVWLADAAEEWNRHEPGTINIAFHELAVTGAMPWSSGFWVAPLQRRLSVRLARVANFRYANTEDHRSSLEIWGAGRTALLFNCSSIVEPTTNPPFEERKSEVVVFGRPGHRRLAYERGSAALASLCVNIAAERIVDIGMPISDLNLTDVGGVPIERYGRLDPADVSERMSKAVASFTYYPITALGKSTIYSVSCAHGTIPFIFDDQPHPRSCPGLSIGEDFIPLPAASSDPRLPPLAILSQMIFDRYQERASWALADKIAKALQ